MDLRKGLFAERTRPMSKAHPGFEAVADKIAKRQGVSTKTAAKELAASTRRASPKAKKANKALKRVKG